MTSTAAPPGTADAVLRRLYPEPDPYMYDPNGWRQDKLGEETWSKITEIGESVVANRHTSVHSSHGIGKSYKGSRLAAWWLDTRPVGEAFVVTTAPTQPQVNAILWREIRTAHRKGKLEGRTTLDAHWYMGQDELVAFGRKPADYADPEKAKAAFQGIHAKYVLVIIDEASGIPKWLWDAVESLATNKHSRVLAIGNPDDPASEFAKVCAPGSGWNTIHVSAFDSPAFTGEQVSDELLDLLVSPTWVEERKKRWGEGSPLYVSKVLGLFPEVGDDTLIPPRLIKAAQLRELPGLERGQYGVDIARLGKDETVVYHNRGGSVRLVHRGHKQTTDVTTGHVAKLIIERRNEVPAVVDVIGIGAGVYDNLAAMGLPVSPFNAAGEPWNKERYINRRAEAYWQLREQFEQGTIDLDELDEDLAAQLGAIKYRVTPKGKIQIESKEDMAKRGLPSPDRGDGVMMACAVPAEVWPTGTMSKERVPGITDDLLERKM